MANTKSNVVRPKSSKPKTTKMDERAPKKPNRSGKQPMVYPSGKNTG